MPHVIFDIVLYIQTSYFQVMSFDRNIGSKILLDVGRNKIMKLAIQAYTWKRLVKQGFNWDFFKKAAIQYCRQISCYAKMSSFTKICFNNYLKNCFVHFFQRFLLFAGAESCTSSSDSTETWQDIFTANFPRTFVLDRLS